MKDMKIHLSHQCFACLLRKHLEGYILEDINQSGLDRIMIFEVKGRNEIGDTSYKKLIVEIMGVIAILF